MKISKQQKIRIGLFAIIAAGLAALVLVVFGGLRFWQHRNHYVIVFDDSVYGLQSGAEVTFNGIRIGNVDKIAIADNDLKKVRVDIDVDEDAPVRADTKALLQMAGLTGQKSIDLVGGTITAPQLASGGTIGVGETTLDKLQRQAKEMVDQSAELFKRANNIVAKVDGVITNLSALTEGPELRQIIVQTHAAAGNLAKATASLDTMVNENRVALKSSIASIDAAAKGTADLIDGQVTGVIANISDMVTQMKSVVREDGAQLKSAMTDLKQASRSFKELARDVKAKPSRLLFSKPESDRKLP
jgi:phospholipid/cholesterol/gamma-HCH transport system substrate-binding protein